jgi:protein TonB
MRKIRAAALVAAAFAAGLLAACASGPGAPGTAAERPAPAPPATGPKAEPATAPPFPAVPTALDLYKQGAARHISAKNRSRTFTDVPEHFLRSIVVVRIVVDSKGAVKSARVDRGNGYRNLEQVAVKAVRDSSPLPAPPPELMRAGALEYSETFLFRHDNRFQIRSIALEQPDPDAPRPVKSPAATAAPVHSPVAKKK